jgi:phage-related tail protein
VSRASKLASARGATHHARHATNVAREKLNRIAAERDRLRKQIAAQADALQLARSKVYSATICHPNGVQYLLEEALVAIDAAGI